VTEYQFTYSLYRRPFRDPLTTSHGSWEIREGIIITLIDATGRSQSGEIAPIPWFGSESIAAAIDWCQQVGTRISRPQIAAIPDELPACQFGCGSALQAFDSPSAIDRPLNIAALLPAGVAALDRLPHLIPHYSTFKWKIGVLPIAEEIAIWQQLMAILPPYAQLRLDANGGLSIDRANQWLELLDRESRIEFIEQPLGSDEIDRTIELASQYRTPIALDESVSTLARIRTVYDRGWRGIYVIKPGIAGFPWQITEIIDTYRLDVVLSSVMETEVGRAAALNLATSLKLDRALGFGTDAWW
jgi:o-succinylbenzoate synthase